MTVFGLPPDVPVPSITEVVQRSGYGYTDCCQECAEATAPIAVAKEYPGREGGILAYECVNGHHWTCAWRWAS